MLKSGHTNIKGFISNCDKYNLATLIGWRVLRFTRKHLNERGPECMEILRQAMEKPCQPTHILDNDRLSSFPLLTRQ